MFEGKLQQTGIATDWDICLKEKCNKLGHLLEEKRKQTGVSLRKLQQLHHLRISINWEKKKKKVKQTEKSIAGRKKKKLHYIRKSIKREKYFMLINL